MTTSADLINRALDHAIDKDPATLKLIIDLVVEYKIAVNQALQLEETIKAYMKDGEKILFEMKKETISGFRRMDIVESCPNCGITPLIMETGGELNNYAVCQICKTKILESGINKGTVKEQWERIGLYAEGQRGTE